MKRTFAMLALAAAAFTSTMAHGQDDHGNATSAATTVSLPSATAGTIDPGNDIDYFRFAVSRTTAVVMETTGSLDTVGRLYDSNGTQLATNDDGGTGFNFRIADSLQKRRFDTAAFNREGALAAPFPSHTTETEQ